MVLPNKIILIERTSAKGAFMKKTYVNPELNMIEISALPDPVTVSNRVPIATDNSNFGTFHPF